ncbi:MAG: GNVR domain-containing protein [Bryobacteraceae bacterium]|nr:GNVR domain-containing protein [Bryobacteraceae bacterium]
MTSSGGSSNHWAIEHFARLIWHRKWLALSVFSVIALSTAGISSRLPNIYSSETVILVDPQKVPEAYVRSTVTGDVRNRLGTLSQQILSATRLQKIVESLNLYPQERRTMAREDVITLMRRDIGVNVLSDFGASQDLQAFRISYSGRDPRLVAQVANQLASLFIEENLKAREQQATGTTDFLGNQLEETRKALEIQEAKLRDFKLKHIGSMPQQEAASLQILGQLQSQLQMESEALARAEQQKSYLQSMMASAPPPVVDLDDGQPKIPAAARTPVLSAPPPPTPLARMKERMKLLLARYSDQHPDVRKLRRQIEEEEANQAAQASLAPVEPVVVSAPAPEAPVRRRPAAPPGGYANPVLESQLRALQTEIDQHKQERERLARMVGSYQSKLSAIPVNEQQITALERDYEISKTHYKELLANQLSAETATQLELRQKGEKFSVLDPAQPAERPSRPNRTLINLVGCLAGLAFGLMSALMTEALGLSITGPEQITAATGIPVLEVIPVIETHSDRVNKRRQAVVAAGFAFCICCLFVCVYLLYRFQIQGA